MSIQSIMQQSKDLLLKHGTYPPTIFVDFASNRKGKQIILDNCPDDLCVLHKCLFLFGRELSEQLPDEDIVSLCFVCECDVTYHGIETEDTTEREALLFQMLEIFPPEPDEGKPTLKLTLHFVEMIRDGAGNLIDLLVDDEPKAAPALDELTSTMAFLSGWQSARMPKQIYRKIVAKARKRNRKRRIAESWMGK